MAPLRTIDDLLRHDLVSEDDALGLQAVIDTYALAITPAMAALMPRAGSAPQQYGASPTAEAAGANKLPSTPRWPDPIALQFLPDRRELTTHPEESADPIGDGRFEVLPGVVHRYRDRVLFKLTHACPVYCRFCFRREMVGPGGDTMLRGDALARAIAYVRETPSIFEVILTGGDPLMLAPERIGALTKALSAIPHVGSLRWHTRVPVVDPVRGTDAMVSALRAGGAGQAVYVGVHTNHVRELTPDARAAIGRLVDGGVVALSQSVLLKGVNASADDLEDLFRALVSLRVRPYYLHHPDLAPGTGHFRLSIEEGQAIVNTLRQRLSGLALPTYVLDIPGGVAKIPIGPVYLNDDHILAPQGTRHPRPRHDPA